MLGLALGLAILLVLEVDRHGVCWAQDRAWYNQVRVIVSVGVSVSARVSASVSVSASVGVNDSARFSVGVSASASVRG